MSDAIIDLLVGTLKSEKHGDVTLAACWIEDAIEAIRQAEKRRDIARLERNRTDMKRVRLAAENERLKDRLARVLGFADRLRDDMYGWMPFPPVWSGRRRPRAGRTT